MCIRTRVYVCVCTGLDRAELRHATPIRAKEEHVNIFQPCTKGKAGDVHRSEKARESALILSPAVDESSRAFRRECFRKYAIITPEPYTFRESAK